MDEGIDNCCNVSTCTGAEEGRALSLKRSEDCIIGKDKQHKCPQKVQKRTGNRKE